jgi:hypothetical protein
MGGFREGLRVEAGGDARRQVWQKWQVRGNPYAVAGFDIIGSALTGGVYEQRQTPKQEAPKDMVKDLTNDGRKPLAAPDASCSRLGKGSQLSRGESRRR